MLEPLGVSADAEGVYRLLLSGPLAADELRLFTRLSPVALRRHLSELAVRGLVMRGSDGAYRAQSAQHLLESAARRQEALSLRAVAQRTAAATKFVVDVITDVGNGPNTCGVQRIDGRQNMKVHAGRFMDVTRHEIVRVEALLTAAQERERAAEHRKNMRAEVVYLGAGISNRVVMPARQWRLYAADRATRTAVRAVVAAGRRFRLGGSTTPQLTIFDRRVALLPLAPVPGSSPGGYIVRDPAFAQRLARSFEALWAGSLTADLPNFGEELSQAQRTVIVSLAGGSSDEVIARKLGSSRRSVARVVAELMAIAGTTSRFQLGVEAIARGWLGGEPHDRVPWQRPPGGEAAAGAEPRLTPATPAQQRT